MLKRIASLYLKSTFLNEDKTGPFLVETRENISEKRTNGGFNESGLADASHRRCAALNR